MTRYGMVLWRGAGTKSLVYPYYASLLTVIATLILLSIPVFVGAQASSVAGWELVGAVESPESRRIEVYLMGGLVRGSLASREFLEKVVWQKDGKTITAKNVVDCHSKVRKLVLLNEYERHRVDGSDRYSLVRSQEPKDPAMKVEPDTLAEMIYNEVCFSPRFNSNVVSVDTRVVREQPYQKEHGQQSTSAVLGRGADVTPPSEEVPERPSPTCTYLLYPGGQSFSSSADSGVITVSTQSNCQWTGAVKNWLHDTGNISQKGKVSHITSREREIIACICRGLSDDEIARRLSLSPHTVKTHLSNIFSKLNVTSRSKLMALATHGPREVSV